MQRKMPDCLIADGNYVELLVLRRNRQVRTVLHTDSFGLQH
jgi:hypothetical protein